MGDRRQIPVPGRHFAFVEVTTTVKYHTLLLDGSEMGVEARAQEMVERGDSALQCQTITRQSIDVRVRPVQNKHLEGRGPRVVVHEHARDPFRWAYTAGDVEGGPFTDIGEALRHARFDFGNDADISVQAEGYPGDGVVDVPRPTAAHVLRYLDTFAGQENTAEEVRDFVQLAARYIDEGKPRDAWVAEPMLVEFADWVAEQPK